MNITLRDLGISKKTIGKLDRIGVSGIEGLRENAGFDYSLLDMFSRREAVKIKNAEHQAELLAERTSPAARQDAHKPGDSPAVEETFDSETSAPGIAAGHAAVITCKEPEAEDTGDAIPVTAGRNEDADDDLDNTAPKIRGHIVGVTQARRPAQAENDGLPVMPGHPIPGTAAGVPGETGALPDNERVQIESHPRIHTDDWKTATGTCKPEDVSDVMSLKTTGPVPVENLADGPSPVPGTTPAGADPSEAGDPAGERPAAESAGTGPDAPIRTMLEKIKAEAEKLTVYGRYVWCQKHLGQLLTPVSVRTGKSCYEIMDELGFILVSNPNMRAQLTDTEKSHRRLVLRQAKISDPEGKTFVYIPVRLASYSILMSAAKRQGTDLEHYLAKLGFIRMPSMTSPILPIPGRDADIIPQPEDDGTISDMGGDGLAPSADATKPENDNPESKDRKPAVPDDAREKHTTHILIDMGSLHESNRAALSMLEDELRSCSDASGNVSFTGRRDLVLSLIRCAEAEKTTPEELLRLYHLNGHIPDPNGMEDTDPQAMGGIPDFDAIMRRNTGFGKIVCLIPNTDDYRTVREYCVSHDIGTEELVRRYGFTLADTQGITPRAADIAHFKEMAGWDGKIYINRYSAKYRDIDNYARMFKESYRTYAGYLGFTSKA